MDQFRDTYEEGEEELDIRDLLVYILRRWRILLAAGIIFGMLLGGVQLGRGLMSLRDADAVAKSVQEAEDAERQYEAQQELLNRQINTLQSEIRAQVDYRENSVLMNLDPYQEYKNTSVYFVSTDYQIMPGMDYQNPDISASIINAYYNIAMNGKLLDYVHAQLGRDISLNSLRELITVSVDYESRMIAVKTVAGSKDLADSLMYYIRQDFENHRDEISKKIGEFQLEIVDSASVCMVDTELINKITQYENTMTQMQNNLYNKQDALNKLKAGSATVLSRKSVLKRGVKFGILGFLAGGFLAFMWFAVKYALGDRMPTESCLKEQYGLRVISVLHTAHNTKLLRLIDGLVDKLAGNSTENTNATLFYELSGIRIRSLSEKYGRVAMIGIADLTTIDRLIMAAGEAADKFFKVGDIAGSAAALRSFADSDATVIVMDSSSATKSKLLQMLEEADALKKEILGIIVIK